ncbi:AzlC family ABC transporter permease [Marinobacterium mangrovicola]|uniref:4-azaleucine resistance transporter AzlC n=1 Tax=Marinobacterium mangrovicola TaxID=1476959 RepID=A0A4R1GCA3_9GAMM|nr:AzlC family ABC transporter permease [Marinobacterium mangrovicola]TCK04185.1 4-azaleucine resistance transporter AzlC [Marinobacterium mangrovicola]
MKHPKNQEAFLAGAKALLPLIAGVLPFGLVTGITATKQGFSTLETLGMTLLFFAGSAQLVALQLLRDGVLPLIILLTVLVINLRFMMYSASIAPHIHSLPKPLKWVLSYMLSDQAYALSIVKFTSTPSTSHLPYFFAGAALTMWLSWNVSVLLGVMLGTGIPESWSLDFAIPLAFLAILVPAIKTSPNLAAAAVGGLVAVLGIDAPYNLGMLLAAVSGISAGLAVESWQRHQLAKSKSGGTYE